VSSACVAAPGDAIRFTLEPERGNSAKIHASFRHEALERSGNRNRGENNWSTGFLPSELTGMDVSSFRAAGTRPLRFAIVREAGRLDCAGNEGNSYATGNCRFTPDAGFSNLLVSRGIGRPTEEQAFGLMAVNARRNVIEAVAAAHYPTPSIDNLMALAALGVDGRYISGMSRVGYRPNTLQSLVEFKALGITPEWIGGFTRIGYGAAPSEELVQLKALNVTPEFITGFDRIGYRHLPVSTLIQLKALDISPEFVRSAVSERGTMPPVNELVEMKIFGKRRVH
jgi:hypothetical protein